MFFPYGNKIRNKHGCLIELSSVCTVYCNQGKGWDTRGIAKYILCTITMFIDSQVYSLPAYTTQLCGGGGHGTGSSPDLSDYDWVTWAVLGTNIEYGPLGTPHPHPPLNYSL